MPRLLTIYLDIETTWHGEPTVVGFRSTASGVVQLVGGEITKRRLLRELPRDGVLYTFNGHCFDLPRLRTHLGVDLHQRFSSVDLRYACGYAGMSGGQKHIEQRIGFGRRLPEVDGRMAIKLWKMYEKLGDEAALDTLLRYNAEDLSGLRAIKGYLQRNARDCLRQS
jgi:uncharacterized protein